VSKSLNRYNVRTCTAQRPETNQHLSHARSQLKSSRPPLKGWGSTVPSLFPATRSLTQPRKLEHYGGPSTLVLATLRIAA